MRRVLDRAMLKFPIIGAHPDQVGNCALCSNAIDDVRRRCPVEVEAMQSVAGATGNIVYVEATLPV